MTCYRLNNAVSCGYIEGHIQGPALPGLESLRTVDVAKLVFLVRVAL